MSIPISAGKLIADTYGYDQVVIVARKVGVNGLENVTTYGVNKAHCDVAARMGDFFKHKLMNWPVPVESQAAEIAKLTALNSALTDKGNSYIIDNAKLTAERDALRADAERYRWLRDAVLYLPDPHKRVWVHEFVGPLAYGETIDAAIDAARAQEQT